MKRRRCTKCGRCFPATLEYFARHDTCRDGLDTFCRGCRSDVKRAWEDAHRDAVNARRRERYAMDPVTGRARILRAGAMKRAKAMNLPFDEEALSIRRLADWLARQPCCACCGRPFDLALKGSGPADASPSLDRFDPKIGYVIGNVELICWRCNVTKRDATADELRVIAEWMARHDS